ncbi:hypothetical protein E6C27_scaffold269G002700 [Cucumis melo var. makuwa]|uniref:Uncharacterized protein n=1 Tax=Cucumis melo var. makuwa TaxID=1194695 RepID=A0A5A7SUH3_CUCMM|nr:hypothetical protein E6C27_scaffold269G002700 [Cucumis melo var. makuwa]
MYIYRLPNNQPPLTLPTTTNTHISFISLHSAQQYSMTNFKTVLEDHFPGRATSLSSHIGGAKKIIKEKLTIDSFMRLEGHIWKVCRNGHNLQQPVSPPYPP